MELSAEQRAVAAAIEGGLALTPRPYAQVATATGLSEPRVIAAIQAMREAGVIKRYGLVLRHQELGYRANAMVVFDIPDERIADIAPRIAALSYVTLCYRRPRRLPLWRYNLFAMIHGKEHAVVLAQVAELRAALGIEDIPHDILFSRRRFKQRGATYAASREAA